MSDEECPHGLDARWCSLCKAPPAGRIPASSSAPTRGRATRKNASGRAQSTGPSTARPGTSRLAPARLSPQGALAQLRPVLFHLSSYGAWESITSSGLRPAATLRADAGREGPTGPRSAPVDLVTEAGPARLRDQRLLIRSRIEAHLDGVTIGEWLAILDERVHLFTRQNDLTQMLTRYQADGQDLIVYDTAAVLAAAGDRVEVATVSSGAPEAWGNCLCRGRDTFVPLTLFDDSVSDIEEVTVIGGLAENERLVTRVVRYHPDRTTEVVWQRS